MVSLVFGLLLPMLAGFGVVAVLWPGKRRPGANLLLKLALAFGLGFGLSSWSYFAYLLVAGASGQGLLLAEAIGLAFLLLLLVACWVRFSASRNELSQPPPSGWLSLVLLVLFLLLVGGRVYQFWLLTTLFPHGHGDSHFIWNLKARFLFRGGENWREIFAFPPVTEQATLGPSDYPLLLPATIARLWCYRGEESVVAPAVVALLYLLDQGSGLAISRGGGLC